MQHRVARHGVYSSVIYHTMIMVVGLTPPRLSGVHGTHVYNGSHETFMRIHNTTYIANNIDVVVIVITRRMPVQRAALSGMKYPTRESPARDAASPISTTNLVAITVAPSTGRQ